MSFDASDRTLGSISIWQVLRKLYWELWLIKSTPEKLYSDVKPQDVLHVQDAVLYATINAASTAHALVDWLYHTIRENKALEKKIKHLLIGIDTSSDKKFQDFLKQNNPAINACHQICNANKHFYLRSPDPSFKAMVFECITERADGTTEIRTGAHIMCNGENPDTRMSTYEMLNSLAVWWESLLSDLGIPEREYFFPQSAH